MNKKLIFSLSAALLLLTGCDYNDKYFDGLEGSNTPTDVKKLEYTLTAADYAAISSNKSNEKIAEAAGIKDQLTALKTNCYFTDELTAAIYAPAFLSETWYTADNGSSVKLTYDKAVNVPEYISKVTSAGAYELKKSDYAVAWDDQEVYFFSPSKPAETYLPRILKSAVSDASSGDYVTVTYTYSSVDPSTGEGESYNKVVDAVEGPSGEYKVKGHVAATYQRGFLLSDGNASILVYSNKLPNLNIGDEVAVSGITSTYSGLQQFGNSIEVTQLAVGTELPSVTYEALDAAAMDAYVATPVAKPIKYTGTLSVSGNYSNVIIEGAAIAQGSLSYVMPGLIDPALNGKKITVYGYGIGASSGKFVNTMVTKVVAADAATGHSSVVEAALGAPGDYTVQGAVVATYARGFLLSDGTASILVYKNSEFVVGDIVTVSGTTSIYAGLKQFQTATFEKIADGTVNYPTPRALSGGDMDDYLSAPFLQYVTYTGTLSISGNYYNVEVEGAGVSQGSLSYPVAGMVDQELNGKKVIVTGYAIGTSSGKFVNTMVTSVVEATAAKVSTLMASTRAAASEETRYAMYTFNGSNWVIAEDMAIVNPADYSKMGISTNYFSSTYKPENYLSQFMGLTYPYAQEGDVKAAVYFYDEEGAVGVKEYIFSNATWTVDDYKETVTDQFVLSNGKWNFDPSTVIELLPTKNEMTLLYMQTATDWVWTNIDKGQLKLTEADRKSGKGYMTSYENNEYYSGCSAYYGNVDMRVAKAREQYPAGYEGLDDEGVLRLMEKHLIEVMEGVLEILHADAALVEGVDVLYTVKVGIYTGTNVSTCTHQMVYKVVEKGKFEYVEDSFQPLS